MCVQCVWKKKALEAFVFARDTNLLELGNIRCEKKKEKEQEERNLCFLCLSFYSLGCLLKRS